MGTLLGGKAMLWGGLVVVGLICLAICCRNSPWKHERPARPPREPRLRTIAGEVQDVPNGATLEVVLAPRFRQSILVQLEHVAAPPIGGSDGEASRKNLERLAGQRVRIEIEGRRVGASDPDGLLASEEYLNEPGDDAELLESRRGDLVGTVYGQTGIELGLAQVAQGWATCLPDAPQDLKDCEARAKHDKRGIWRPGLADLPRPGGKLVSQGL
jgi:endonuclease YncB( thermonuclease family)